VCCLDGLQPCIGVELVRADHAANVVVENLRGSARNVSSRPHADE
jgi:hypothetical protein